MSIIPCVFSLAGKTSGLLGNFNGDPDDDFQTPDGSLVAPDADMKTIHYEFGLLCMIARYSTIVYHITSLFLT